MSSYATMDHADWVRVEIAAHKNARPKNNKRGKHVGWSAAPDELSPLQSAVMDILGMVAGGIYNAPIHWDSVDWNVGGGISVLWWGHELATFDFDALTRLVFMCHAARIRCSVRAAAPDKLRLSFWQRSDVGGMASRHPDLDEAVQEFREYLPPGHRIVFGSRSPAKATQP